MGEATKLWLAGFLNRQQYSIPETNSQSPENRPKPKRRGLVISNYFPSKDLVHHPFFEESSQKWMGPHQGETNFQRSWGGTFSNFKKSAKGDFDLDEMEGLDNVTWTNRGESARGPGPFQLGGGEPVMKPQELCFFYGGSSKRCLKRSSGRNDGFLGKMIFLRILPWDLLALN